MNHHCAGSPSRPQSAVLLVEVGEELLAPPGEGYLGEEAGRSVRIEDHFHIDWSDVRAGGRTIHNWHR